MVKEQRKHKILMGSQNF